MVERTGSSAEGTVEGTLELDVFNRNSCMVTVLRVIDYMTVKFIHPSSSSPMPGWMAQIHDSLNNVHSAITGRLFLVKLLMNRPAVFMPYAASHWITPIMATLLEVEEPFGSSRGMHYFLQDTCELLLMWHAPPPADSLVLAEQFLDLVLKATPHPSGPILRRNVRLAARLASLLCRGGTASPSRSRT